MGKDRTMMLSIGLDGHQGQAWPKIRISFNNTVLFDDVVIDSVIQDYYVGVNELNLLSIEHYDKCNDTVLDQNGNIIKDRYCELTFIKINQLTFDLNFFSNNNIPYCTNDGEKLITTYFGKNGCFNFEFPTPLWKFWYQTQKLQLPISH
jgi:hypothetical protein